MLEIHQELHDRKDTDPEAAKLLELVHSIDKDLEAHQRQFDAWQRMKWW